jgi:hypothetical protein
LVGEVTRLNARLEKGAFCECPTAGSFSAAQIASRGIAKCNQLHGTHKLLVSLSDFCDAVHASAVNRASGFPCFSVAWRQFDGLDHIFATLSWVDVAFSSSAF